MKNRQPNAFLNNICLNFQLKYPLFLYLFQILTYELYITMNRLFVIQRTYMIIPNAIRVFNNMSSIVSHHGLKTFSASVLSSRVLRTSPSKAIEAIIQKHNSSLNKTFNSLSVTGHQRKKTFFHLLYHDGNSTLLSYLIT